MIQHIFVPTYNRRTLPVLKLLSDKNIRIHLCLRHERIEDGKEFSKIPGVSIVDLGTGIEDIGQTRKRIVNWCMCHNYNLLTMVDDGIDSFSMKSDKEASPSECIGRAISFLMKKQLEHPEVFCYTFYRDGNRFLGVNEDDEYFVGFPLQAEVIDLKYLDRYDFNFQSMKVCGLEDIAFFIDAVKKGLIFVSDQDIVIDGKLPNVIVDGGNHSEGKEAFEKKRDRDHSQLMKYVGNMYGIMLTKKYRESLGMSLTYAKIDYSYFRDVLVFHRDENKKLIESKFMIGGQ